MIPELGPPRECSCRVLCKSELQHLVFLDFSLILGVDLAKMSKVQYKKNYHCHCKIATRTLEGDVCWD